MESAPAPTALHRLALQPQAPAPRLTLSRQTRRPALLQRARAGNGEYTAAIVDHAAAHHAHAHAHARAHTHTHTHTH